MSRVERRRRHIAVGKLLPSVLSLGGGSALGQLLVLVAAPLITRLYSPTDLAQFGLLQAFVAFASVGVCLRLDLAIVSAATDADAMRLLLLCLGLCVVLAAVTSVLLWLLIACNFIGFGVLERWVLPAAFALLWITGAFVALRFWAVRKREFRKIAAAMAWQGAGRAAFPLLLGAAGTGWGGLVMGELAGRTLGVRSLGLLALPELRSAAASGLGVHELLRKYRQYWLVVLPSSLLNSLALALPIPVVVATYGVHAGGLWVLVTRVAMAPGQFVAAAIADVFHAEAARQRGDEPDAPRRWLMATLRPLLLVATLAYGMAGVAAPFAFRWIFGEEWADAGWLMLILAPAMIPMLAAGATGRMLMLQERSHWKLLADALNVIAPLVAFYGGVAAGSSFLEASAVFCVAYAAANLVYLVSIWLSTRPR